MGYVKIRSASLLPTCLYLNNDQTHVTNQTANKKQLTAKLCISLAISRSLSVAMDFINKMTFSLLLTPQIPRSVCLILSEHIHFYF